MTRSKWYSLYRMYRWKANRQGLGMAQTLVLMDKLNPQAAEALARVVIQPIS